MPDQMLQKAAKVLGFFHVFALHYAFSKFKCNSRQDRPEKQIAKYRVEVDLITELGRRIKQFKKIRITVRRMNHC